MGNRLWVIRVMGRSLVGVVKDIQITKGALGVFGDWERVRWRWVRNC